MRGIPSVPQADAAPRPASVRGSRGCSDRRAAIRDKGADYLPALKDNWPASSETSTTRQAYGPEEKHSPGTTNISQTPSPEHEPCFQAIALCMMSLRLDRLFRTDIISWNSTRLSRPLRLDRLFRTDIMIKRYFRSQPLLRLDRLFRTDIITLRRHIVSE